MKYKTKLNDVANARYERGVLTLDLPRAIQPVLWRQEIKNISTVTVWIETKETGEYTLMLRLANGTEQNIARFKDELTAQQSLAAIRDIFFRKRRTILGIIIKVMLIFMLLWAMLLMAQFANFLKFAQAYQAAHPNEVSSSAAPATPAQPAPAIPTPTPAPPVTTDAPPAEH